MFKPTTYRNMYFPPVMPRFYCLEMTFGQNGLLIPYRYSVQSWIHTCTGLTKPRLCNLVELTRELTTLNFAYGSFQQITNQRQIQVRLCIYKFFENFTSVRSMVAVNIMKIISKLSDRNWESWSKEWQQLGVIYYIQFTYCWKMINFTAGFSLMYINVLMVGLWMSICVWMLFITSRNQWKLALTRLLGCICAGTGQKCWDVWIIIDMGI